MFLQSFITIYSLVSKRNLLNDLHNNSNNQTYKLYNSVLCFKIVNIFRKNRNEYLFFNTFGIIRNITLSKLNHSHHLIRICGDHFGHAKTRTLIDIDFLSNYRDHLHVDVGTLICLNTSLWMHCPAQDPLVISQCHYQSLLITFINAFCVSLFISRIFDHGLVYNTSPEEVTYIDTDQTH